MKHLKKSIRKRLPQLLLAWYRQNKRDLPWRKSDDPYKIWVSEIMLQQTQVTTVKPYYSHFLERFPDVASLAAADLDDVLKCWEGLGYYSRARNLHKAARLIIRDENGIIPSTFTQLLKLPGVGKYTAGAIASIAFGHDEILIDGNVRRVMARVLKLHEDPKTPEVEKSIEGVLRALLPQGKAGTFNQALMELGATICTSQSPLCTECPIELLCEARSAGLEAELPIKTPRKPRPHFNVAIGIIWKDGRVLITKRPENKLLGGLWEFPGGKQLETESIEACLLREIWEELSIEIEIERSLPAVEHGYTHFTVTLHPYECHWIRGEPQNNDSTDLAWIELEDIDKYAFPRGNRKILEELFERQLDV